MKKLIRDLKSWLGIDEIADDKSSSSEQANQLEEYRKMIEELNRKYSELAAKISHTDPPSPSQPQTHSQGNRLFTVKGVSFEMVYVEGGTFEMGGTTEQGGDAYDDEYPVHSVTLSDYYIGKYEVTQELWKAVMGSNPSEFKGADNPVENVSWNDCQEFVAKLNKLTGKTFRLPTEAEWEYAARGGKNSCHYKYSGSNNIDDVAWYSSNSGETTHPVGTKAANELGIYDMSGNVEEWCSDWYGSYSSGAQTNPQGPSSGSCRVLRGGSWRSSARNCRVSARNGGDPGGRSDSYGLRLAIVP
ncbi:MAG: SUMF1/EgtB/PvdO family nonheme iron enzyme [Candidatus Limimorpha sp.]